MGEVKELSREFNDLLDKSGRIINNRERYKKDYQRYLEAKRKNKLDRLDQETRKNGEFYQQFISRVMEAINKHGFSDEIMEVFLEANGVAEAIASTITFKSTQLRKIFHQLKIIKQEIKSENSLQGKEVYLIKIMPLLAYSKGRGLISEDFYELSKVLIMRVKKTLSIKDFNRFVDIFEAIVAYHKYYNPKEN